MATIHILNEVRNALLILAEPDQARISARLHLLEIGEGRAIFTKKLRGPIQEMIVRQYRLIFFHKSRRPYVVDIFKKQSRKTPRRIIERAEKIYNTIP